MTHRSARAPRSGYGAILLVGAMLAVCASLVGPRDVIGLALGEVRVATASYPFELPKPG